MAVYSTINGVQVAEDNNFSPQPSILRAGEMTNGLGQSIGDFVRTQYVLAYKWEWMPQDVLNSLITATDPLTYPSFSVTHSIPSGAYAGTYRVTNPVQAEKLFYDPTIGAVVWSNVTLTLQEV